MIFFITKNNLKDIIYVFILYRNIKYFTTDQKNESLGVEIEQRRSTKYAYIKIKEFVKYKMFVMI